MIFSGFPLTHRPNNWCASAGPPGAAGFPTGLIAGPAVGASAVRGVFRYKSLSVPGTPQFIMDHPIKIWMIWGYFHENG
jgi:hypothetical protein